MFQNVSVLFMSDIIRKRWKHVLCKRCFQVSVKCPSKINSFQCFFLLNSSFFTILHIQHIPNTLCFRALRETGWRNHCVYLVDLWKDRLQSENFFKSIRGQGDWKTYNNVSSPLFSSIRAECRPLERKTCLEKVSASASLENSSYVVLTNLDKG